MPTLHHELHPVCSPQSYALFEQPSRLPEFDPGWLSAHRPDAHWVVTDDDRVIAARCSLWWRATPRIGDGAAGLIGHYAASDESSADVLLQHVTRELASRGCSLAVGPMDQNTWRDYRFVIEANEHPSSAVRCAREAFFMEPSNAPEWPDQFVRNGFRSIATYFSSSVEDLCVRSPRLDFARQRMVDLGIEIRPLRADRVEEEIRQIFSVARAAFADHLFYSDISAADFLDMYRPLLEQIETDLVLLAESAGCIVGFCFAVPDLLQAKRNEAIDTVIVKTLGVLPERKYAGLGQMLLEEVHCRASAMGFRQAIHALVRDTAPLWRITRRYGAICRRYALFGKELSS
jgi:GNAT superfamily N-acetyltransferase